MKYLILIIFLTTQIFSQTPDPKSVLDKIVKHFNQVKDYEVDIKVIVNVDFLKVPESNAKLYFKQPDKVRIKSESFALLPKEGLDFSPTTLLSKNYTAFFEKHDTYNGAKVSIIKVIPLGQSSDVILSTLWVDESKHLIRKIETTTKTSGTYMIQLKYDKGEFSHILPSEMLFTFNVNQLNIPTSFTGDINGNKNKKKSDKPVVGTVNVFYNNYKINKGLKDSIFED